MRNELITALCMADQNSEVNDLILGSQWSGPRLLKREMHDVSVQCLGPGL